MVELIRSEIMDSGATIGWDDIAGLEFVKRIVKEIVVCPMLRPDIFTGLKAPPKGLLLFGPPGTGKTLIGERNLYIFYVHGLKPLFQIQASASPPSPARRSSPSPRPP